MFSVPAVPVAIMCAFAVFALFLLWRDGLLQSNLSFLIAAVLIAAAFFIRTICLDHMTLDYVNFLSEWVQYFRVNGGFRALSHSVGNYNLPYLYFLALFSYIDLNDLYLIKLLSTFFDIVLAWGVMRTVGLAAQSKTRKLTAFIATLFLPTVILNGAYWGQCDSIYTAFAVLAVYLALDDKPIISMICITLSFAFKLQAVFVMPVFFVLLLIGKIKFRHFFVFPAAYLAAVLPAVLLGRPLLETVTLYFSQAGSIGSGLNYNSPSVFALVDGQVDEAFWSNAAIIAAFIFVLLIFVWLIRHRSRIGNVDVLTVTLLFAIGIPFLLPHMHDRYFFAADVFSLVLAVIAPRFIPQPVLVSFASLLGYHAYLMQRYLLPMRAGSLALIAAIYMLAVSIYASLGKRNPRKN